MRCQVTASSMGEPPMTALLRTLFSGPRQIARVRGRARRHAGLSTGSVRSGVESLESRAMLAANDVIVSLVGDRVSLARRSAACS